MAGARQTRLEVLSRQVALKIVQLGMKNSAIKQENIVRISNFLIPKKSANKQQNSANKHTEHFL